MSYGSLAWRVHDVRGVRGDGDDDGVVSRGRSLPGNSTVFWAQR